MVCGRALRLLGMGLAGRRPQCHGKKDRHTKGNGKCQRLGDSPRHYDNLGFDCQRLALQTFFRGVRYCAGLHACMFCHDTIRQVSTRYPCVRHSGWISWAGLGCLVVLYFCL
jgi:hypothetical protein